MLLRARYLAPMAGPLVENGAILIENGRVKELGPWKEVRLGTSEPVEDLGEVVVLPGLVNAHVRE
jgi:5-methylthioadenosine/S-adenosylhomocysteine deaminase